MIVQFLGKNWRFNFEATSNLYYVESCESNNSINKGW